VNLAVNLVVGSCFRNSAGAHIARYRDRIARLQALCDARGITLHVVAIWGDCRDRTEAELWAALRPLNLHELLVYRRDHGFPEYGSSEHPDRLAGFAHAANGVFEAVGDGADAVVYVESDLIWEPETLLAAVRQLRQGIDIIGIPTFCGTSDTFYDTWGFRTPDGRRFGPFPPYWDEMRQDRLHEVGTVGGCVVMRGEVARACRCSKEEAIVGLCKDALGKGYKIWTDWRLRVEHP
jgi:hypothetical protein